MRRTTALVTGAGGAVGSTLVRRLSERGYAVRALVRETTERSASMPQSVEIVRGDITDGESLRRAVEGVDVVFHLAAKLHVSDPPPDLRDEYERVNVEGTRTLGVAAQAAGASRFIFFSTINVYGATQPRQVLSEDAALHPDSLYAETKARAEEFVRETRAGVVLRIAAVYGPGMKGNFPRLLHALRRGRPVIVGDGLNRRTLVYIEDVCRAAVLAAEHEGAAGQTFNVTDGSIHSLREIVKAISDALGKRPPRLRLPKSTVRCAAGMLEDVFKLAGRRPPVSRALVDKLTEDVAVSGSKIQRELGFRPEYDLALGWRETIRLLKI